jgi:predicted Zn finger-like uncharacterized protein
MAQVEVKCTECYTKLKVDEGSLGKQLKCPKCKQVFYAELGDSYGLAAEPAPARPTASNSEPETMPERMPSRGKANAKPTKTDKKSKPESKAEREQRERLEKWSKSME